MKHGRHRSYAARVVSVPFEWWLALALLVVALVIALLGVPTPGPTAPREEVTGMVAPDCTCDQQGVECEDHPSIPPRA